MNVCQFDGNTCTVCGAPRINASQVCGSWRPGLGDRVAYGLEAVGITKERVSDLVGRDCGCKERQDWLNMIGYRIGVGAPPGQPRNS